MLSWECFFTQQQRHSHTYARLVHGRPQGLLLWLGGRSDAPVTRWWSCVESLWIGGTWVYSPCVASAARKPTGEGGVGLGGSVLEEAHPCFPCFIQPWRWFHLLITLFEKTGSEQVCWTLCETGEQPVVLLTVTLLTCLSVRRTAVCTQGDSDVSSSHIYASWFSPPSCR